MSQVAIHASTGNWIIAEHYEPQHWDELKRSYVVGELLMECCKTAAIPKTSINGCQFFAHLHDECATAPETIWHSNAKILVQGCVQRLGIPCESEKPGGKKGRRWKADVYFEVGQRRIAIEIQQSPQTLRVFLDRQKRYEEDGVECYWIVIQKQYITLSKAVWKYRVRNEFGGREPSSSQITGCMAELPAVTLELEPIPKIKGPSLGDSVEKWIDSVVTGNFKFYKGVWMDQR